MTVSNILTILLVCSTVSSLVTEAVKRILDDKQKGYSSNILVLIVSLILGWAMAIAFCIKDNIPFTAMNIICIIVVGIANWLCAMFGYDKIKQTFMQIKGDK